MSELVQQSADYLHDYMANLKTGFFGKLCYYCLPYRKRVVLANMHFVFQGVLNTQQIKQLAQAFYGHLIHSVGENIKMRFSRTQTLKQKATVKGAQKALKAAENNKGLLILTGHFGNWELAPIAGIMNFPQFQHRFYFVRKTLGAKWIEKILFRRYFRAGLRVIPKKNALNPVCDALDAKGAVVFVMDQHAAIAAKDGIAVEFFGKLAGTFRSLASLAKYTGAPVVPAMSYRDENGKHVLEFFDPIAWQNDADPKQELYRNTKHYNEILEGFVLKRPEQWLWSHRRWKI